MTQRIIASEALEQASSSFIYVLIIDTSGRLHVDETAQRLHWLTSSDDILFVVDSMARQDAVNIAEIFIKTLLVRY